ncbi:PAS domain S-box protein [Deinococcus aquaedulcis]|uniref:PAS domain S-box protein n=1 Tax=Deinococcus aquaedulcis TaxID=2840455 RepID=UPI001C828EF1|nr:PAS domain S-box protein [Deinococcus aquaedulcis]
MSPPAEEAVPGTFALTGAQAQQLLTVARALFRAVSRTDVKRVILDEALRVTGAYGGTLINVLDDQTLYLVRASGYDQPLEDTWQHFPMDPAYPVVQAIQERRAVFASLPELRGRFPTFVPLLQPQTRAVAAIPLMARGQVLSALTLSFREEQALTPERQAFLLLLVDLCAEALERGRLHDAQQRARERATVLSEVSRVLAASLDVQETLERITTQVIAHLADWCAVYQADEAGRPQLAAVAHQDPARVARLRGLLARFPSDPASPGSAAWVLATGQDVLLSVIPPTLLDSLPTPEQRQGVADLGLHSLIQVPMNVRGRRVGVLGVASSHPSRTYGPDDLELVRELAGRAALALDNAELYEAAQFSAQRYRSLVDATRQTVWTNSANGQMLGEQPGWAKLTGQPREVYEGAGWAEALHPEDRAPTLAAWRRAVDAQAIYEVRQRVRVVSGEYRHFHVKAEPVKNADGTIREWVGVHTDITDQLAAEQELRDREARYRALVEHAAVGVGRTDHQGRWLDVNHAAETLLGYTRAELLHLTSQDVTHPEDRREGDTHPYHQLVAGLREAFTLEKRYVRKDGEVVWAVTTVSAVRSPGGEFEYAVAVLNDITARKQAEEQARQLARVIEETGDFVAMASLEGEVQYLNPAGGALVGLPQDDAPGLRVADCFLPGDLPFVQEVILPTTRAQGRWTGDFRLRHFGTGEAIDVNYNQFVVTDPASGAPMALATVSRDIRERKRIEAEVRALNVALEERVAERTAELQQANRELARSNTELERFAFVASHDLQEPLRSIASFSELLDRRYGGRLDDQGRQYLGIVTRGAQRMKSLIDDLLVFSRLNAVHEPFTQVDMNAVLREALARLHAATEAAGAQIKVGPLPVVSGAPEELTRLVQNLLGNALKFRRDGVPPEVCVLAQAEAGLWHFTVADNGIGIEPQYQHKVFEMFQRLHIRDRYEGTGLGLAIVRKIAERHGGAVWLDSEPGRGTTVHFTLQADHPPEGKGSA